MCAQWWRSRDRERQNPKQALHCEHRAQHGVKTHEQGDHDLSRNQETDAQPTEPCRHPIFLSFYHNTWHRKVLNDCLSYRDKNEKKKKIKIITEFQFSLAKLLVNLKNFLIHGTQIPIGRSFKTYLLNTYYIKRTETGAGDTAIYQTVWPLLSQRL